MGMSQDLGPQIYHSILSTFARKPSTVIQKSLWNIHMDVSLFLLTTSVPHDRWLYRVISLYPSLPILMSSTCISDRSADVNPAGWCCVQVPIVTVTAGVEQVSTWLELGNQNLNKNSINEIWLESHHTLWIRNGIRTFLYKKRSSSGQPWQEIHLSRKGCVLHSFEGGDENQQ